MSENASANAQPVAENSAPIQSEALESSEVQSEASSEPSSQAELQEAVQDAIDNGASKQEIKEMIEEFELKVNGKTLKKKLNLLDKEAVKRELQLAAAGQQSMQRAKELEKVFEQEVSRLMQNPWEVLEELGYNPDELAEARLRAKVQELEKSPEQREREQLQKELEKARAELKKREEDAKRAEEEKVLAEQGSKLENEIMEALSAHTTLPNNPKTVARIADAMLWAMDNGFDDVSVQDVLPAVETEIKSEIQTLIDQLGDDVIEEYIGQKNLDRVRKKRLAAAKAAQTAATTSPEIKQTSNSLQQEESKEKKKLRTKDFFRNLR